MGVEGGWNRATCYYILVQLLSEKSQNINKIFTEVIIVF